MTIQLDSLKIAVVHDWFETYAGSERVVEQILQCFPHSDVFSLVDFLPSDSRGFLEGKVVKTSFVQKLPFARRKFRHYFRLMPLAIEQFDLTSYDVVISSSHAFAKGVLTRPDQLHVSYVHTPIRYAWDFQHQYLREAGIDRGVLSWITRWMLHYIRLWDLRTVNGVDVFAANSRYVARRIAKLYRRDATVIYPPVDTDSFSLSSKKENFYLAASRMVPYKRMDLPVAAFSDMPDRRLIVIGDGPELSRVKAAAGPNVEFLGHQPFDVLRDYMQRAKAFVFAAEEDFGIMPVESQACGTPVIAFKRGGAAETVVPISTGEEERATGLFFDAQNKTSLIEAVEKFERDGHKVDPAACRQNALRFSAEKFRSDFVALVRDSLEAHGAEDRPVEMTARPGKRWAS